jgi:predicted permease
MTSTVNNVSFESSALPTLLLSAIIGVGYTLALFFLSKPLTAMEGVCLADGQLSEEVKLLNSKKRGMLRFSAIFSNNGFLGIPLAYEVLGKDSPAVAVLIIINIITNLAMLTLGDHIVSGGKIKINPVKLLTNPVVLGFAIGAVLNVTKVNLYIPEVLSFTTHFSNLVTPISMTILGMKMGSVNLGKIFTNWKTYYASFIKLILTPTLIIAILFGLKYAFGLDIIDKWVLLGTFIAFSMPTAGLASALADKHDGDIENSVVYTLGTTIISIITIPLLYMILNLLI